MRRSVLFLLLALIAAPSAAARDDGFDPFPGLDLSGSSQCTIDPAERRSAGPNADALPLRAECSWAVSESRVHQILVAWESYPETFSNVLESRILQRGDGRGVVVQVHGARGISDREVVLEWEVHEIPDGHRLTWTKSASQSAASGQNTEVAHYRGTWETTRTEDGVRVVQEIVYAPGGRVPGFALRWFQRAAARRVLDELWAAVERPDTLAMGPTVQR